MTDDCFNVGRKARKPSLTLVLLMKLYVTCGTIEIRERWYGLMAIYRLEAKVFSREKRGRSVVAAAAYRAGKKLRDALADKVFDYTRRTKGVVATTILTPEGAPEWAGESGQLWNRVEAGEKRVDAQLAREFILSVPPELNPEAQFALDREGVGGARHGCRAVTPPYQVREKSPCPYSRYDAENGTRRI